MKDLNRKRQRWADQMVALIYKSWEKPAPEFMEDLSLFINGTITYAEILSNITLRYHKVDE